MPVQAESLEILEKADVAPAQARAIVRAIEIELAGAKDTLATKHDVLALRHNLEIVRSDLRREISELGSSLRGEMAVFRGEMTATPSGEMAAVRGEMATLRGDLRAEIHASASSVTRQLYMATLGQTAVMLGFVYFFATHVS